MSESQAENQAAVKSDVAIPGNVLRTRTLCHVLGVSTSGYYAWKDRAPSACAQSNVALTEAITRAHAASDEIYGAHKIHAELRDVTVATHDSRWVRVGKNRVAKLMREACLRGVSNRRSYIVTTERNKRERPAPDLVNRKFVAIAPNQLWVADITYVPTWAGFVFLAVVLDVWSRKVVGWHIGDSLHTDLIVAALEMAAQARKPQSVIHHSDQGCQYTSVAFGKRCKELNVRPSMGTVGDAYEREAWPWATTRWPRVSSHCLNANCYSGAYSKPKPMRRWHCLLMLRLGTTVCGAMARLDNYHHSHLNRNSGQQQRGKVNQMPLTT